MKINNELDQDGCLDVELIENSVAWQKEEGGDNILLQYINGGEGMRIVERFAEDVDITEAHHNKKALYVKFADGQKKAYYQDAKGNYKSMQRGLGKMDKNMTKLNIAKIADFSASR